MRASGSWAVSVGLPWAGFPASTRGSGGAARTPSKKVARSLLIALGASSISCQPPLVIGTWECAGSAYGDSAPPPETPEAPLVLPWRSGFEDGFCGFGQDGGFCYANPDASYEVVREPAHSGTFAAAFNI